MKRLLYIFALSLFALQAAAQGDMAQADRFSSDALYKYVRNSDISVSWCKDDPRRFYYSLEDADGRHWYTADTKHWRVRQLIDNESYAEQMKSYGKKLDPESIYLSDLHFRGNDSFLFTCADKVLKYDMRSNKLSESQEKLKERKPYRPNKYYWRRYSADSLYYIAAVGHDLYLYNTVKQDSTRLTDDGATLYSYAMSGSTFGRRLKADAVGSAEGWWIGDTHNYFVIREDKRELDTLSLVDNLASPRPKVKSYHFAMPGDKGVIRYSTYLVDADKAAIEELDCAKFRDQKIETPRFGSIKQVDNRAYFIRRNRTCDSVELCAVDLASRSIKCVISERCFPRLNEQLFDYHIIDNEIFWWSERSGKGQIFRYNREGKLLGAITPADMVAGKIVRVDSVKRKIVFEGYGGEKDINPHYKLYYGVDFDGKNLQLITPGNGDHTISFSPDGQYIVDHSSRMDSAPVHRIYDRRGRFKLELGRCDLSELYAKGWSEPKVVKVIAADSLTELYGIVYLPFGAKKGDKFPIISNVYPGPHTDLVPQGFTLDDNYNQSLAQLGFVVINFSYRGACPYRGRDYYAHGYKNLRDYALDDDKATIRQVAEKFECADTTRVGIYGHSGGGFMTVAAMLTSPEFYKVGFAASGNHDNNIYTQWWGETFHGGEWVNDDKDEHFECKIPTNIELAANLQGKLMLVTGDMDNNVHPASTFRLADALIKSNKRFDMLVIPGADHGLGDKYYGGF